MNVISEGELGLWPETQYNLTLSRQSQSSGGILPFYIYTVLSYSLFHHDRGDEAAYERCEYQREWHWYSRGWEASSHPGPVS
jgi:hypothetical protein